MSDFPTVEAEITLLPESEGGRSLTPGVLSGGGYRPHVVIGDPAQRHAVVKGNETIEEYLGVEFVSGPDTIQSGVPFSAKFLLLYYPHPMYRALVPGVTFTIREGARIIGLVR